MGNVLTEALKDHRAEVEAAVAATPDWDVAVRHWDAFFRRMADPGDELWSAETMEILRRVYYAARDADKECTNITDRTVKAMPPVLANDTKKIFLQIASACRIFNASHKVNFESSEVPVGFEEIPMVAGKSKGTFTYGFALPTLHPKISLTFDYWVPKVLDWCGELREKGIRAWRDAASLEQESCTDFMRCALMFLSDPVGGLPVCKQDLRLGLVEGVFGEAFLWVKKSAKREDVVGNSRVLVECLGRASSEAGVRVPVAAWGRVLELKGVKGAVFG